MHTPARPLTGKLLALSGWGVDALQDAAAAAICAATHAAGVGPPTNLPQPLLAAASRLLPPGLVQQLGIKPAAAAASAHNQVPQ